MAFQQNNFNANNGYNNNNGGAPKKKSNFGIGRIYGSDGTIDVSVWKSEKGGCYCIVNMKAAVGKDPSSGQNVYEQKMANELPSAFMSLENAKALLMAIKDQDPSTLNICIDNRGSKISVNGSGSSVKVTIDHQKNGTRSVTLDAVSVGSTSVHASFENFISFIEIGYKKMLTNKLDPEEFAMVADNSDNDTDGTAPF